MAILIGDVAPDFEAETTEGRIRFHDYIDGKWAVLFSHPKNFTPVCTTELGYTAKLKPEFDKRGVKVLGLSVDKLENHAGWSADIQETQGVALNFPLIADTTGEIAKKYEMIHPNADNTLTVRSVFVVGPDKKVKLKIEYPGLDRPQLRRSAAGDRQPAAHRQAPGGDAGELEERRGRDHRPGRDQRAGQREIPRRLEGSEALPSRRSAAPGLRLSHNSSL